VFTILDKKNLIT